jgi:hypothetical protein
MSRRLFEKECDNFQVRPPTGQSANWSIRQLVNLPTGQSAARVQPGVPALLPHLC